jgi:hypothetical protein
MSVNNVLLLLVISLVVSSTGHARDQKTGADSLDAHTTPSDSSRPKTEPGEKKEQNKNYYPCNLEGEVSSSIPKPFPRMQLVRGMVKKKANGEWDVASENELDSPDTVCTTFFTNRSKRPLGLYNQEYDNAKCNDGELLATAPGELLSEIPGIDPNSRYYALKRRTKSGKPGPDSWVPLSCDGKEPNEAVGKESNHAILSLVNRKGKPLILGLDHKGPEWSLADNSTTQSFVDQEVKEQNTNLSHECLAMLDKAKSARQKDRETPLQDLERTLNSREVLASPFAATPDAKSPVRTAPAGHIPPKRY